ncbi:hypothetical protein GBAR_LOCUS20510 [Geodia barretti]|uniref:Uncharacterized protein n=1 Tax=Geodia barretti TaxID=519541 RepID=A0AA35X3F1_GEOBA|nr:hypothetical protein GBAR_LOCUS20510 [Geodia barretti]
MYSGPPPSVTVYDISTKSTTSSDSLGAELPCVS